MAEFLRVKSKGLSFVVVNEVEVVNDVAGKFNVVVFFVVVVVVVVVVKGREKLICFMFFKGLAVGVKDGSK